MVAGSWIILDELNLAPNDVLEALNRVLDDNRELIIHKTQETIVAAPGFRAFGTQNPAETPLSCLQEPFPRAPLRPAAAGGAGDNSGEAMRAAAELQPEDGRCWTSYRCTGGAARPSPAGRDSSAGRASSLCGTCSGDSTSSARMLMLTRGTVQLRAWCEHWHQTQSLLRSNRAGVRWLSQDLCTRREESPAQSKVGGIAAKTSLDQLFVQYKCTVIDYSIRSPPSSWITERDKRFYPLFVQKWCFSCLEKDFSKYFITSAFLFGANFQNSFQIYLFPIFS